MLSFENKKGLRIIITLADGKTFANGKNVVTIEGFRSVLEVTLAGDMQLGSASIRVFGLSKSVMDSCTSLMWEDNRSIIQNTITVTAIDGTQESLCFSGNIVQAWGDYQAIPDVCLYVQATSLRLASTQAVPPVSYRGAMDVASAFQAIAYSAGKAFENNGVQSQLYDVYLPSTATEQMRELAKMANIDWGADGDIIWIAPKGAGRNGLIPLISKETGMIGYPTFDGVGVSARILYNPAVRQGGKIQIDSDVSRANGQWIVNSLSHSMAAEMPDGQWFTIIRASKLGLGF